MPRQARDKHRKSRKKKLFPAGTLKSYWRFTSDDPSRTRLLFTLLKLGLSGVKFSPDKDDSNITHVEGIGSPEYPGPVGTVDTNFGLAISRWGIRTLLEIAVQEPELQHDPAVAKYSHVLSTLVPFSADSTGYMLDPQHRFLLPHRHWSHIILIYDLELKEGRFNHTAGACISHLVSQPAYSSLKNPENGPEYAIQEQRTKLNGCVVSCTLTCRRRQLAADDLSRPLVGANLQRQHARRRPISPGHFLSEQLPWVQSRRHCCDVRADVAARGGPG